MLTLTSVIEKSTSGILPGVYRYTYVLNNPLKYTDPSGYTFYWKRFEWERKVTESMKLHAGSGSPANRSSSWWDLYQNMKRDDPYSTPQDAMDYYDDATANPETDGTVTIYVPVLNYHRWTTGGDRIETQHHKKLTGITYRATTYNTNQSVTNQHETQAYSRLTDAERALAKNNQGAALIIYRNMNKATKATKSLFPGAGARNDAADAFRHAYFSALNARSLGYDLAFRFGVAHEQFPGNDPLEMQMDISNNIFGYNLSILEPEMSTGQLIDYIYNAVQNGELLMLNKGQIVPTR